MHTYGGRFPLTGKIIDMGLWISSVYLCVLRVQLINLPPPSPVYPVLLCSCFGNFRWRRLLGEVGEAGWGKFEPLRAKDYRRAAHVYFQENEKSPTEGRGNILAVNVGGVFVLLPKKNVILPLKITKRDFYLQWQLRKESDKKKESNQQKKQICPLHVSVPTWGPIQHLPSRRRRPKNYEKNTFLIREITFQCWCQFWFLDLINDKQVFFGGGKKSLQHRQQGEIHGYVMPEKNFRHTCVVQNDGFFENDLSFCPKKIKQFCHKLPPNKKFSPRRRILRHGILGPFEGEKSLFQNKKIDFQRNDTWLNNTGQLCLAGRNLYLSEILPHPRAQKNFSNSCSPL